MHSMYLPAVTITCIPSNCLPESINDSFSQWDNNVLFISCSFRKKKKMGNWYIVGFFLDGFFPLQDVIYFFSLRADLEDYFNCMT